MTTSTQGDGKGSVYTPPPDVTRHNGDPIPANAELFAPPPPAIGEVLSAETSLTVEDEPKPLGKRIVFVIIGLVVGVGIAMGLIWLIEIESLVWQIVVTAVSGGVCALGGWGAGSFSHTLSYVGTLGIAETKVEGDRDNVGGTKLLEFDHAVELKTDLTDHYKNGIYQNTSF